MKIVLVIGAAAVLFISHFLAFTAGQSSVRRATVVRSGEPYYTGVFFGECAWSAVPWKSIQFCATDDLP